MKYRKLSDIADILNGYAFKSKEYVSEGIRIIRIANVQDGYVIDDQPCFYPNSKEDKIEKYKLEAGDLLVSLTGNVGRVGLLDKSMLPAALNQRVACIRITTHSIIKKFLYYYLRQTGFMRDCIGASKGVAQLNLSTKWLKDYLIPVPDIDEQEKIVIKIEESLSALDHAIETLNKTKEQLAVYRQAVLKMVFENVIDSTDMLVNDVCDEIKVGIVIKPSKYYTTENKGVKAFRSANVREFHIDDFDWVYLSEEGQQENQRSIVHTGDVLIVRSGYPGTACVVTDKFDGCNAIDVLIAVPNKKKVMPEYLCAFTNSPRGKMFVEEKKRGVGQKHFNVGGYKKMLIPIPSLAEQRRIVEMIDDRLSVCQKISEIVDDGLSQATALRQSVLKEAFEGRLV